MATATFIGKDRRISFTLGAVLGVASLVAGAGATWATMRSDLKVVSDRNADQDRTLEDHAAKLEKLSGIYERLAGVEGKLDLIVRKLP